MSSTVACSFKYQIHNLSQSMPWMTIDGNHERDYPGSGSLYTGKDSGGECGVPYEHRFHMPNFSNNTRDETWYSLNYGPVHFTVISTEHAFDQNSIQGKWVAADFAAVDRTATPFL